MANKEETYDEEFEEDEDEDEEEEEEDADDEDESGESQGDADASARTEEEETIHVTVKHAKSAGNVAVLDLTLPVSSAINMVRTMIAQSLGLSKSFKLCHDEGGARPLAAAGTVQSLGLRDGDVLWALGSAGVVDDDGSDSGEASTAARKGGAAGTRTGGKAARKAAGAARGSGNSGSSSPDGESEVAKLKRQNAQLRQQLLELNQALDESLNAAGESVGKRKPRATLSHSSNVAERELQNAQKQIERYKKTIEEMRAQSGDAAVHKCIELENQLTERDSKIKQLRSELRGLQNVQREQSKALEAVDTESGSLATQLRVLTEQLQHSKKKNQELKAVMAEREKVHQTQLQQLVRLQERNRKMAALLKSHNLDLNTVEQVTNLREEADATQSRISDMQRNVSLLEKARDAEYKKRKAAEKAAAEAEHARATEVAVLQERVKELEKELKVSAIHSRDAARKRVKKVTPMNGAGDAAAAAAAAPAAAAAAPTADGPVPPRGSAPVKNGRPTPAAAAVPAGGKKAPASSKSGKTGAAASSSTTTTSAAAAATTTTTTTTAAAAAAAAAASDDDDEDDDASDGSDGSDYNSHDDFEAESPAASPAPAAKPPPPAVVKQDSVGHSQFVEVAMKAADAAKSPASMASEHSATASPGKRDSDAEGTSSLDYADDEKAAGEDTAAAKQPPAVSNGTSSNSIYKPAGLGIRNRNK